MSELINANPTIRNASDLPSRRREPSKKSKTQRPFGLLSSHIPDSAYAPDPFNPSSASESESSDSEDEVEPIDEQEIYAIVPALASITSPSIISLKNPLANSPLLKPDLISQIQDPEHPLTLGSLSVVNLPDIYLTPTLPSTPQITTVTVLVTPTITHCSLATVIGLGVRVRLEQALPPRFRVDVRIKEGTHSTAESVNRQLGDKERVAAALENGTLAGLLRKMLEGC
ncbi:MAG: hypothetical protein Q9220_006777 [cf. Caloplaca sp. 1 TL-2023]